jgi:hypothetical protein
MPQSTQTQDSGDAALACHSQLIGPLQFGAWTRKAVSEGRHAENTLL